MGFERFGWVSYAAQSRVGQFVDHLQTGGIYATRCKECGFLQFPPRAHCTRCLSQEFEWRPLSGRATLVTYTKLEAPPASFKPEAPYTLALAELAEGPKILAWIDKSIPEDQIMIGMKLQVRVAKLPNEKFTYVLSTQTG